jgi:hypothetical protein
VAFVHPTVLANRFVNRVNRGDCSELQSLKPNSTCPSMHEDLQSFNTDFTFENCKTSAKVPDRTFRDRFKVRRRINVHIEFPEKISTEDATLDNFLVSHPYGIHWGADD